MEKRFAVRRTRAADITGILEIEKVCFGPDAYDRNLFAEYTRKCGELFLVAMGGTKLVGYSICCLCAARAGNRAELVSLAVNPGGSGARAPPKALMDSTLRRLKLRGVRRFGLTVKVTNGRAIAFYEKYGFVNFRRAPGYYEDGADGQIMVKNL